MMYALECGVCFTFTGNLFLRFDSFVSLSSFLSIYLSIALDFSQGNSDLVLGALVSKSYHRIIESVCFNIILRDSWLRGF